MNALLDFEVMSTAVGFGTAATQAIFTFIVHRHPRDPDWLLELRGRHKLQTQLEKKGMSPQASAALHRILWDKYRD